VSATVYFNHPYGTPIIGWEDEMRGLTREDAIAFYNQYYTPNNAILVISGDVTEEEVKSLSTETYGKVERRAEPPKRIRPQEPPHRTERRVTIRDERVTQPNLQIVFITPSYVTAEKNDALALDILSEILGGGSTSRLYRALVADGGIAAYTGSYYRSDGLDDTQFAVYGIPREVDTLKDVEAKLIAEVNKIRENGVSKEEVERSKRKLIANTIFTQDSQTALARIFGSALATGETVDDVQTWPAKISTVTPEDVQRVAKKYLETSKAVFGIQLPKSEALDTVQPDQTAVPSKESAQPSADRS
jgi:zinc protease